MLIFLELGLFLSMHDKSEFEQDYGVFAEDGETLPHGHLKGRGWVKTNISPRRGQERGCGAGLSQLDGLPCCRVVPQQWLFGHRLCDFVPHSC